MIHDQPAVDRVLSGLVHSCSAYISIVMWS